MGSLTKRSGYEEMDSYEPRYVVFCLDIGMYGDLSVVCLKSGRPLSFDKVNDYVKTINRHRIPTVILEEELLSFEKCWNFGKKWRSDRPEMLMRILLDQWDRSPYRKEVSK